MSPTIIHEHDWKGVMFSDSCHSYQNIFQCDCGARMSISGERQMSSRGKFMSGIFMADDDCERCNALIAGARRKPTKRIIV